MTSEMQRVLDREWTRELEGRVEDLTRALENVLAAVWPDLNWTPHDPDEECDEFCAMMRTLHEAQDLLGPGKGCRRSLR